MGYNTQYGVGTYSFTGSSGSGSGGYGSSGSGSGWVEPVVDVLGDLINILFGNKKDKDLPPIDDLTPPATNGSGTNSFWGQNTSLLGYQIKVWQLLLLILVGWYLWNNSKKYSSRYKSRY